MSGEHYIDLVFKDGRDENRPEECHRAHADPDRAYELMLPRIEREVIDGAKRMPFWDKRSRDVFIQKLTESDNEDKDRILAWVEKSPYYVEEEE